MPSLYYVLGEEIETDGNCQGCGLLLSFNVNYHPASSMCLECWREYGTPLYPPYPEATDG